MASESAMTDITYLCRLANLLADDFPLVRIVFLDRGKQRGALLNYQHAAYWGRADAHFIFREFCIMHVLEKV